MNKNNLLASVALFSELHNSDKDIYDIIAELIKGAIQIESKWSFASSEITSILKKVFDFDIPDAVIKTVLKIRLKRDEYVTLNQSIYTVTDKIISRPNNISNELEKSRNNYLNIINTLVEFLGANKEKNTTINSREEVEQMFNAYLVGQNISEIYSKSFNTFLIKYQNQFGNDLKLIKEGLVLYNGVKYTADLNSLGTWNTELTIFLDTEHLFNALGYNGVAFEEIFKDFYQLVKEINIANTNRGRTAKIYLKYFEENKREVEKLFDVAAELFRGVGKVDLSKTALQNIINGCKDKSDILQKQTNFFINLKSMGISEENPVDYYKDNRLVTEGNETLLYLKDLAKSNNKYFDEKQCNHFLKLFTKINVLRKGVNNNGFENIKYLFVTGSNIALFYGSNTKVKFNDTDIPFATDIDFVTNRFWFKLKKGFSNFESLPKSFDMVTKAQIIMSSYINKSIAEKYDDLLSKYNDGSITEETAREFNYTLREKIIKPEEVTPQVVENNLSFLNELDIEAFLREKTILNERIEKGEYAIKELEKIKAQEKLNIFEHKLKIYHEEETKYITSCWEAKKEKSWKDFRYLICACLPEFFVAFLVFFVKANKELDEWFTAIGDKQYYFWGGLALFFMLSSIGKTYIFDKEKVKNGWKWFCAQFKKNKLEEMKKNEANKSSIEFRNNNPKPNME